MTAIMIGSHFGYDGHYTLIVKDHLGHWSPEKDCCLWLTFRQLARKPSSESSDSLSKLKMVIMTTAMLAKVTMLVFSTKIMMLRRHWYDDDDDDDDCDDNDRFQKKLLLLLLLLVLLPLLLLLLLVPPRLPQLPPPRPLTLPLPQVTVVEVLVLVRVICDKKTKQGKPAYNRDKVILLSGPVCSGSSAK